MSDQNNLSPEEIAETHAAEISARFIDDYRHETDLESEDDHCLCEAADVLRSQARRIKELEQYKEWAAPQIVHYGEDQMRIAELESLLAIYKGRDEGKQLVIGQLEQPQPETAPVLSDEVQRVLNRLNSDDPDFDDCVDAVKLIHRLVADSDAPKGFATWKDAAIAERLRRVEAERQSLPPSDDKPVDLTNRWDSIQDFITVLQAARSGQWHWPMNTRCKYVELRVDMRDGGCIIKDREGKRITPAELAYQYGQAVEPGDSQ